MKTRTIGAIISLALCTAIPGCGGGGMGQSGSPGGQGGTTGGSAAPEINATAQFEVDVKSGKVSIKPLGGPATSPTGAPAAFRGSMIGFNSSLLVDEPGSTADTRKVLTVALTNNSGETIGTMPSGEVTGLRVLFSSLTPEDALLDLRESTVVSTLAGNGNGTSGYADGPVASAAFNRPSGVACEPDGSVWVADYANERIRRVFEGTVTTAAGSGRALETDGAGTNASFSGPWGIAYDAADGSFVVADYSGDKIRRVTVGGQVTTIAGTGAAGSAMGAGNLATFTHPSGVAITPSGTIYISGDDGIIRQITYTGTNRAAASSYTVASYAGAASSGYADGQGGAVRFKDPRGLALDPQGDLFVADAGNNRIRFISPGGLVSTIAGTGAAGISDGTGIQAAFNLPEGIAYDNGAIIVTDENAADLRQVSLASGASPTVAQNWNVAALAGVGLLGFFNGSGSNALFNAPYFIAVDSSGDIQLADHNNNAIRTISPVSGTFPLGTATDTTSTLPIQMFNVTGTIPSSQYGVDEPYIDYPGALLPGGQSQTEQWGFNVPQGDGAFLFTVTVEANTSTLADPGASLNAGSADNDVRTFAGGGPPGYVNGVAAEAEFSEPVAKPDRFGNVYIADANNDVIRLITPQGMVGLIAGGVGLPQGGDGTGTTARFISPDDLVVSPDGTTVYIVDHGNCSIRMMTVSKPGSLDPNDYQVYTIAGGQNIGHMDGYGNVALFDHPDGIAMSPGGDLYVSEYVGQDIRRIFLTGNDPTQAHSWSVQTVAGTYQTTGHQNGTGENSTSFDDPVGLACDLSGNLYIADQGNYCIRKMTPAGTVTTFAGTVGTAGYADGAVAKFESLQYMAMDSSGYLYAADLSNNVVRRIDSSSYTETVAGVQTTTGANVDGPGNGAKFNEPFGVGIDESGNLYITQFGDSRIALVQRVLTANQADKARK